MMHKVVGSSSSSRSMSKMTTTKTKTTKKKKKNTLISFLLITTTAAVLLFHDKNIGDGGGSGSRFFVEAQRPQQRQKNKGIQRPKRTIGTQKNTDGNTTPVARKRRGINRFRFQQQTLTCTATTDEGTENLVEKARRDGNCPRKSRGRDNKCLRSMGLDYHKTSDAEQGGKKIVIDDSDVPSEEDEQEVFDHAHEIEPSEEELFLENVDRVELLHELGFPDVTEVADDDENDDEGEDDDEGSSTEGKRERKMIGNNNNNVNVSQLLGKNKEQYHFHLPAGKMNLRNGGNVNDNDNYYDHEEEEIVYEEEEEEEEEEQEQEHRVLQANINFKSGLDATCNTNIDSKTCTSWSTWFASQQSSSSEMLKIPCGTCVTLDLRNGENVDVPQGLSVIGKLVVPNDAYFTFKTKAIVVQGLFRVEKAETGAVYPHPQGKIATFVFEGADDDDIYLLPEEPNADLCPAGGCKLGSKVFGVAGGTVDIQAYDEGNCPPFALLQDAFDLSGTTPTDVDFDPPTLPSGCERNIIPNGSFDDDANDWSGFGGARVRVLEHSGTGGLTGSYIQTMKRPKSASGIQYLLNQDNLDCIIPEEEYIFTGKMMLTSSESPSSCSQTGENCPFFDLMYESTTPIGDEKFISRRLGNIAEGYHELMTDESWFTFTFFTSFSEDEMQNSMYLYVQMAGSELNVQIALDDISLVLHSDESHPGYINQCNDLSPADGSATNLKNGLSPFPYSLGDASSLAVLHVENDEFDEDNKLFVVRGRDTNIVGLEFEIPSTKCLDENTLYEISMKYRLHDTGLGSGAEISIVYPDPNGGETQVMDSIGTCPSSKWDNKGTWTYCSLKFTVTTSMSNADYLIVKTNFFDDSDSDIDYDDISFKRAGPANALLLDNPKAAQCWGANGEIIIASDTSNTNHHQTATIQSVDKQSGIITLTKPLDRTPTTLAKSIYAVEVALLNRNLIFKGVGNLIGGHFIVYHTPTIEQKISGIELQNFGQQGNLGRYPLHMHMSEKCPGTVISYNVVRNSNQRCVVIHGTHDVLIEHNVCYDNFGHGYLLEDGGEYRNKFHYNLGMHSKKMPKDKLFQNTGGETDHVPGTFWFTNPMNDFIGNHACGSKSSGFWMEYRANVRGPSKKLPENFKVSPRQLPLGIFKDNVAHANQREGVKTYPTGHEPSSTGTFAVYENLFVYRNGGHGIFFHNTANQIVKNSHFADNVECIRNMRARDITFQDSTCIGRTEEYLKIRAEVGPQAWSSCVVFGVTYTAGDPIGTGVIVSNVDFSGFDNDIFECKCNTGCSAHAFSGERELNIMELQLNTVTLKDITVADKFSATVCRSVSSPYLPYEVKGLAIEDYAGQFTGTNEPGFLVQNEEALTDLSPNEVCKTWGSGEREGTCLAHCPNECRRLVLVQVSPSTITKDYKMVIKDLNKPTHIGTSIRQYQGENDGDPLGLRFAQYGYFSTWLTEGDWEMSFIDSNNEPVWPGFAKIILEKEPQCSGYIKSAESSITQIKPYNADKCKELIYNGSFDNGLVNGWHRIHGKLEIAPDGTSMRARARGWISPIAQYLDISCLIGNNQATYKITGEFAAYRNGEKMWIECDPNTSGEQLFKDRMACPELYINLKYFDFDKGTESNGKVIIGRLQSNADGSLKPFEFTFRLPSVYKTADSAILMILGGASDYYIDNFSLQPVAGASGEEEYYEEGNDTTSTTTTTPAAADGAAAWGDDDEEEEGSGGQDLLEDIIGVDGGSGSGGNAYQEIEWVQINGKGSLTPEDIDTTSLNRDNFDELFNNSPNKIIKRECASCQFNYETIYYKRLTDHTDVGLIELLEDNWVSVDNEPNVDFALYSNYEDALEDINRWKFISFHEDVGCCHDSGLNGPVFNQWASFNEPFEYGEGQKDVAYYVESAGVDSI